MSSYKAHNKTVVHYRNKIKNKYPDHYGLSLMYIYLLSSSNSMRASHKVCNCVCLRYHYTILKYMPVLGATNYK